MVPARRNLVTNPNFNTNISGWVDARGTLARSSGIGATGVAGYGRFTADGTVGGNYVYTSPYPRVDPGDTVTSSIYVRGFGRTFRLYMYWIAEAGGGVGSVVSDDLVSTGDWLRLSVSGLVPSNATSVQMRVFCTSVIPSGSVFDVDAAMIEVSPTLGDYFDGSYSVGVGRTSWIGSANASQSVLITPNPNPSDDVRLEVAFTTKPDVETPDFRDMTSRLDLTVPIDIKRGRPDEFARIQPSVCSLTLDNTDGALTAGNASSPYAPNVLPMRKMRLSYRDPGIPGNLLSVNAASLETSDADWYSNTVFGTKTAATFARSTAEFYDGAASCLVTWPTTADGSAVMTGVTGLVIGRRYTASAYVFVPAGGPDVRMEVIFVANGSVTAVKDQWVRISVSWVATQTSHTIGVGCPSATAGQTCYFDAVQVDEGSAPPAWFTTANPPIINRFTGFVEEWPVEWPGGGAYSQASITAVDRLARIGGSRPMRSVIEETILATASPFVYYPLGEPELVERAGDSSTTVGTSQLAISEYGTPGAGELTFGTATGPPTDGMPAPTFLPASINAGKFLSGPLPEGPELGDTLGGFATGLTLRACFLTSVSNFQTIARITDVYGYFIDIGINTSGKVTVTEAGPWDGTRVSLASVPVFADGQTHDVCVTFVPNGLVRLYVDGVAQASFTPWPSSSFPAYRTLSVGGSRGGLIFNGSISHVAAWDRALTAAEITEIATATTTGFEGESSDARISRYGKWAGLLTSQMSLDAGSTTAICFTETTGQATVSAMQDVADTEAGRLFVDTSGQLVLHARSRSYANPAPRVQLAADQLGEDARFIMSTQDLANDINGKRPNGPTSRATDPVSIEDYGRREESITLLAVTDAEVQDAINWRLSRRSRPTVKLPSAGIDAFAPDVQQLDLLALEIGDRLTISGLPSQAPAGTLDFIVEGYGESISLTGWRLTPNLSNYADVQALVLDDDVYGLLDSSNRLIY